MMRIINIFIGVVALVGLVACNSTVDTKKADPEVKVSLVKPYPLCYAGAPTDKISVQYAVMEVAKLAGYKYDWPTSYKNTDPVCRQWLTVEFKNLPFKEAMGRILDDRGLTYEITNQTIVLKKKAGQASVAALRTPDLGAKVTLVKPYPLCYAGAPTDKISVQYAVMEVAKQAGYEYDWSTSYENTNPVCRQWLTMEFKNLPFKEAMGRILDDRGLTYEITNRAIVLKKRAAK